VLYDQTADGYRYLHVGVPGQETAGLWLMSATTGQERDLVGRQCGGQPLLAAWGGRRRPLMDDQRTAPLAQPGDQPAPRRDLRQPTR
jgi:hypothetical protein